ncbi:MAG: DUF2304 family protein [Acidimicrobiia bacterium]
MLLGFLGLLLALMIVVLARLQLLTLRYALGWFFVAVSIGASGALTGLAEPLADSVGLRPVEFLLGVSLFLLLLISVQLSITASGLTEMLRTVSETLALTEERVRRLEKEQGSEPAAPPPVLTDKEPQP